MDKFCTFILDSKLPASKFIGEALCKNIANNIRYAGLSINIEDLTDKGVSIQWLDVRVAVGIHQCKGDVGVHSQFIASNSYTFQESDQDSLWLELEAEESLSIVPINWLKCHLLSLSTSGLSFTNFYLEIVQEIFNLAYIKFGALGCLFEANNEFWDSSNRVQLTLNSSLDVLHSYVLYLRAKYPGEW